jgi:hypothetical protein
MTPTAILLIRREPFKQNGSRKIDCATEKRRLSAAFEAKSRKASFDKRRFFGNLTASRARAINLPVD